MNQCSGLQDKVLKDLGPAIRKRVLHLVKHPTQLAALQAARKAAAEAGSSACDASGKVSSTSLGGWV